MGTAVSGDKPQLHIRVIVTFVGLSNHPLETTNRVEWQPTLESYSAGLVIVNSPEQIGAVDRQQERARFADATDGDKAEEDEKTREEPDDGVRVTMKYVHQAYGSCGDAEQKNNLREVTPQTVFEMDYCLQWVLDL